MLRPTDNNQGTMRHIRPRTTAELNKLATIQVNPQLNIKHYFRSADILIKQARVYYNEGDYENAYILFLKYTNLGLTELRRHPSYKAAEHKRQNKIIKLNCLEALDALETLKPQLDKTYEEHLAGISNNGSSREPTIPADRKQPRQSHGSEKTQVDEKRHVDDKTQTEDDGEEEEKEEKAKQEQGAETWSMQDALRGVAGVGNNTAGTKEQLNKSNSAAQAQYPPSTFYNQSDSFNYVKSPSPSAPPYAPPLPPKPTVDEPELKIKPASVPPLPPKIKDESPLYADEDQYVPKLPPKIGLEEQEDIQSGPASMTEGGMPLRYLYLPNSLQKDFLRIAHSNTTKNIETCGILCGTLKNNVLRVTTMIIPRQSGTPDSCTTENEEELFDYQDSHELLTFGWIHTHPSQSCFLSSLDLHTHCSYQVMLPEAVAIVCAPKHDPSYGIFRLTDPPGLPLITNCRAEGAFHPHPDEPIYTDTHNDTGHVRIKEYSYEVVDLRG